MRLTYSIYISIFLVSWSCQAQKTYQKNYDSRNILLSEGWLEDSKKTDFWRYYYPNGNVKKEGFYKNNMMCNYWYFYRTNGKKQSEGHFVNGKKNNWWLFYDSQERIDHKCQITNDVKNGYCLMYKNEKLVAARQYQNGKQVKEWTNFWAFKRDNNLQDLK